MPPGRLRGAGALAPPLLQGPPLLAAGCRGLSGASGLLVLLFATTLAHSRRGSDTGMLHHRCAWGPVVLQGQPRTPLQALCWCPAAIMRIMHRTVTPSILGLLAHEVEPTHLQLQTGDVQAATVMLSACPNLSLLPCAGTVTMCPFAYLASSTLSACLRLRLFLLVNTWQPALLPHGLHLGACITDKQNCSDAEELHACSSVHNSGRL